MRLGSVLVIAGIALYSRASAADCSLVSRTNVVPCAIAASPHVRADAEGVIAARGRRSAADPWFPSNPVIAFSGAHRQSTAADAVNFYGSLSQEIEIAGQRASRRHAADAD